MSRSIQTTVPKQKVSSGKAKRKKMESRRKWAPDGMLKLELAEGAGEIRSQRGDFRRSIGDQRGFNSVSYSLSQHRYMSFVQARDPMDSDFTFDKGCYSNIQEIQNVFETERQKVQCKIATTCLGSVESFVKSLRCLQVHSMISIVMNGELMQLYTHIHLHSLGRYSKTITLISFSRPSVFPPMPHVWQCPRSFLLTIKRKCISCLLPC